MIMSCYKSTLYQMTASFTRPYSNHLQTFADQKNDFAIMNISVLHLVENTVEKGENAAYQLYFICQKHSFPGSLKLGIML